MKKFLWPATAFIIVVFVFTSCETLKESSKYKFSDGFYKMKENGKKETVYVLAGTDTIKEYRKASLSVSRMDTVKAVSLLFPAKKPHDFTDHTFMHASFDLDVLTVLFKYRPPARGFPPQFNATFNGAVFIGYRTDLYKLSYTETPLHDYRRHVTHYGYSMGLFTGFGTARIDEYVTGNALNIQYDGLVNLTGIALILAVDKLTAGLTFGEDHLLDRNKKLWFNNGKVWIGLSIGLNLN
ncbi:MAG: hypothetical protein ABIR15_16095 [Chitinophagaceae bacterium]